jgi:hypothetical protein
MQKLLFLSEIDFDNFFIINFFKALIKIFLVFLPLLFS